LEFFNLSKMWTGKGFLCSTGNFGSFGKKLADGNWKVLVAANHVQTEFNVPGSSNMTSLGALEH
jgi:hypothetical protein